MANGDIYWTSYNYVRCHQLHISALFHYQVTLIDPIAGFVGCLEVTTLLNLQNLKSAKYAKDLQYKASAM